MRLLQSFTTCPMPGPPTCTMRPANASSAGVVASSTAASPPTIRVSVPFWAPAVPPDRGASRYRAPVAPTRSYWARSTSGSMVEQSTTVCAAPRTGNMPSTTSATSGEFGTHKITTSEASATPRGEPPSRAPLDTADSIGPRLREATVTSWPAATRWPAIGSPMAPSPTNPMRMRQSSRRCGGLRELWQPLGGAGEQLVDHGLGDAKVAASRQRIEGEGLARQHAVAAQCGLDRELLRGDMAPHDLVVGS